MVVLGSGQLKTSQNACNYISHWWTAYKVKKKAKGTKTSFDEQRQPKSWQKGKNDIKTANILQKST